MKKIQRKLKLELDRQTLRRLSPESLAKVRGAVNSLGEDSLQNPGTCLCTEGLT